jgi:hypothetical protein
MTVKGVPDAVPQWKYLDSVHTDRKFVTYNQE